ncbi:MAG: hypothetical protein AAGA60_26270 [Cyanobacteria bacterium P01_E01_bin.42]
MINTLLKTNIEATFPGAPFRPFNPSLNTRPRSQGFALVTTRVEKEAIAAIRAII